MTVANIIIPNSAELLSSARKSNSSDSI